MIGVGGQTESEKCPPKIKEGRYMVTLCSLDHKMPFPGQYLWKNFDVKVIFLYSTDDSIIGNDLATFDGGKKRGGKSIGSHNHHHL